MGDLQITVNQRNLQISLSASKVPKRHTRVSDFHTIEVWLKWFLRNVLLSGVCRKTSELNFEITLHK